MLVSPINTVALSQVRKRIYSWPHLPASRKGTSGSQKYSEVSDRNDNTADETTTTQRRPKQIREIKPFCVLTYRVLTYFTNKHTKEHKNTLLQICIQCERENVRAASEVRVLVYSQDNKKEGIYMTDRKCPTTV